MHTEDFLSPYADEDTSSTTQLIKFASNVRCSTSIEAVFVREREPLDLFKARTWVQTSKACFLFKSVVRDSVSEDIWNWWWNVSHCQLLEPSAPQQLLINLQTCNINSILSCKVTGLVAVLPYLTDISLLCLHFCFPFCLKLAHSTNQSSNSFKKSFSATFLGERHFSNVNEKGRAYFRHLVFTIWLNRFLLSLKKLCCLVSVILTFLSIDQKGAVCSLKKNRYELSSHRLVWLFFQIKRPRLRNTSSLEPSS